MKIGFIGLGKMGANMVTRLIRSDHEVVAYDVNKEAVDSIIKIGAVGVGDIASLLNELGSGVVIWLMIPSQFIDNELDKLLDLVPAGSLLIDGGNSDFRHTQERAQRARDKQVRFIDVGTSGGILGLEHGYAMMVGGDEKSVHEIAPILDTLAPKDGWHHFGDAGSGHYVKMVHNAIEYGVMESYAEGYRLLKDGPMNNIDLHAAGMVWQQGSIIQSLLNELITEVLAENTELTGIEGFVNDSGEARWALEVAKDSQIETPSIQAALDVRVRSQQGSTNYATKLLAAMRNKFGGHAINKEK